MKKIILAIPAIITIAVTSSCERKFTCTCVYPGTSTGTTTTTIKATKKSDAEATCANLNTAVKAQGGSCAL